MGIIRNLFLKLFIAVSLPFFLGFTSGYQDYDCVLEVIVKTKDNNSNLNQGEVLIEVSNGKAPYSYLFYDKNQKALSTKIESNKISNLEAGTYYITVLDNKGCLKTVEFRI